MDDDKFLEYLQDRIHEMKRRVMENAAEQGLQIELESFEEVLNAYKRIRADEQREEGN